MISLEGLTISRLPYNNILLDGCENARLVKMRIKRSSANLVLISASA